MKNRFKKVLGNVVTLNFLIFSPLLFINASVQAAQQWYRYYDNRGIANISTTVSPEHIRHGYDTLDANMAVIRKTPPFQSEQSLQLASQREQSYKQRLNDIRLKEAYSNSRLAEVKKREMLKATQQQITFYKKQINVLYSNEAELKRQEQQNVLTGKPINAALKTALQQNADQIQKAQHSVITSQMNFQRIEQQYDAIIYRLKILESQS